jgi:rubrerythrin
MGMPFASVEERPPSVSTSSGEQERAMSKSSTQSPIDDLTYDVITVLQNKAKALEAYDKYLSDAESEDDDELKDLFTEMRRQDEEHVQVLKEALARRLDDDLGYDEEEDDAEDEDYDDEDELEVEEPASTDGDDAVNGSVIATGGEQPPRRGESTTRHR